MQKNFSIFKNKPSENEKAPTHRISMKVGDEYISIGACWSKQSNNGEKYLSCKLQDIYVDHTNQSKSKKGFAIVNEKTIVQNEIEELPEETDDVI